MVRSIVWLAFLTTIACRGENARVYKVDTFPVSLAAARGVGSISDDSTIIESWLLLRRATKVSDSGARKALYDQVTLPVAKDRIPWVEAQILEELKDYTGALAVYKTVEAPISQFRMQHELAMDESARDSVRQELLDFIKTSQSPNLVREGIQVFDRTSTNTNAREEHLIARAAADIGWWARAERGFAEAEKGGFLTDMDQFRYATALFRLRRFRDAGTQFVKVQEPRTLTAAARYQRARSFVAAGDVTDAKRQLRQIESTYPSDTSAAAALWLLADLEGDAGRDAAARTLFREIIRRFPDTRFGRAARINSAVTSYVLGEYKTATIEFDAITNSPDSALAYYWLGRSHERIGATQAARSAWQQVLGIDSLSYYGALAARRLGTKNIQDVSGDVRYPFIGSVDSAMRRIRVLHTLDMTNEIRYENDRLFQTAQSQDASLDQMLATAAAFANTDQAGRAIALGRRILSEYGASASVYRLIYPIAARDTIITGARGSGLDPILIASLIRQESNFNPRALSPVGARGLMQLMPDVARSIAVRRGIQSWSNSMLDDPGINIMLGITHLAPLIRKYPDVVQALSAYNAGESRVARWSTKAGADDPELFTERIPYPETRDYVKSILRNREFYRALYTW